MASPDSVTQEFVKYYYTTFDSNREALGSLYRDNSFLTFEGGQTQGATAIVEKLKNLPLGKVQHQVDTTDFQQGPGGCLMILVTGRLIVEGSEHPQMFCQSFTLLPVEGGGFMVANDVFRLVYGS